MKDRKLILEGATAVPALPADRTVELLALWLHGKAVKTQNGYLADVKRFLAWVGRSVHQVTLRDLQLYADDLEARKLKPATRRRALNAIKSLLSFGHRQGLLPVNVGAALRMPKVGRGSLSERILPEADVLRLIHSVTGQRNRTLLLAMYATGARVAEICALRWRDLQPREDGGQVNIYASKTDTTRHILPSETTWRELMALGPGEPDDPVFRSQRGGHLSETQAWRIVKAAAANVAMSAKISPHWFRHAHASHSQDRGAPAHLVQTTLGHASLQTTTKYSHARPNDSSARYLGV